MTKRRVILTIRHERETWGETYLEGDSGSFTEDDKDLQTWAEDLLIRFNRTRRGNELERFLVSAVFDTVEIEDEDWDEWGEDE